MDPKTIKENIFNHYLKILTNSFAILALILFTLNFFSENKYNYILPTINALYISLLSIYATNKEFNRWKIKHKSKYSGEVFVYIWTFLIILAILISLFSKGKMTITDSTISSYIAVITIFAITRKSKSIFTKKNKNNIKNNVNINKKI